MSRASLACAPLLVTLSLACGSGGSSSNTAGSSVSCTTSIDGMNVTCEEIPNATASDISAEEVACNLGDAGGLGNAADGGSAGTATFAMTACTHTGAAGGCLVTNGPLTVVTWYYTALGFTMSQVQTICMGESGATFVSP